MKTFAEIEITFADDITSGTITFIAGNLSESETFTITEEFTGIRSRANQVNVVDATDTPGQSSAVEFAKAFNADYNLNKQFLVEVVDNVVTIKSTVYEIEFDDSSFDAPVDVTADFVERGPAPFQIISVTYSEHATDKCGKVMVSVLCNYPPGILLLPVTIPNPNNNPIVFEYPRTGANTVFMVSREGDIQQIQQLVPGSFNAASININVAQNPTSSTVTAIVNVPGLTLQYSMNGTDFQSSNVFTNIVPGSYTMYVRDQFGCTRQKAFQISDVGSLRLPYIHIPKSNSFRFANRITWGDCANYKNDENTLSCETDDLLPYKEIQQFQSCDIITSQFRSNYEINDVVISGDVDPLVDPVFIPVVKKTNNMNLMSTMTANRYVLPNGKTGFYFTEGIETTGSTESAFSLNGNLPEWGVPGNWVRVELSWYMIENVIFDEDKQAFVLVVTTGFNAAQDIVDITCFYDRYNYEVYEFTIDLFNYLDKRIQVNIHFADSVFEQVNWISEVIDVKVRHKNTTEIRYKNKHNTDVYFGTGIEFKVRVPLERQEGLVIEDSENHKTDTDVILLNAEVYEGDKFEFGPVTKEIMRQLVQAFHHSDLKINGVDYTIESLEVEGPLEDTNLYLVKPTLIKSKAVYSSDTGDMEFSEGSLQIPGFIDAGDDGFIKYF